MSKRSFGLRARTHAFLVASALAAILPAVILAAAYPVGDPFSVSSSEFSDAQSAVAMSPDGSMVVAWVGSPDGGPAVILSRRYDSAGQALGDPLPLNPGPLSHPDVVPDVAIGGNSSFVVVWPHPLDGTGPDEIHGRLYGPGGISDLHLGATDRNFVRPAVAMDADGEFILIWYAVALDGSSTQLRYQRFTAYGEPDGLEVVLGTVANSNLSPDVAMDADGNAVVTWFKGGRNLHYALIRDDGTQQGGFFDRGPGPPLEAVRVAVAANGEFVIAWQTQAHIRARRFGASSGLVLFSINENTETSPGEFELARSAGGRMAAAWASCLPDDPANCGVFVRQFDTEGVAVGEEVRVDTLAGYSASDPAVGMDGDGDFTVTWTGQRQDLSEAPEIYGRQYDELDDTMPDPFDFADLTDVPPGSVQASEEVVITGVNLPTPIHIGPGEYSLNGAAFTAADGWVQSGDRVRVRHTASPEWGTTVTSQVRIGEGFGEFSTTTVAQDRTPDPFAFEPQVDVDFNSPVVSNAITVSGIDGTVTISVSPFSSFRINGMPPWQVSGTVSAGQSVQVRHLSATTGSTTTTTTVTIGDVTGTFTSTTRAPDTTPDAFALGDFPNAPRDTEVASYSITVAGISDPAPISVSGGSYRIDSGAYTTAVGTVQNGQRVSVMHRTASTFSTATNTTLTIGGVSDTFTSTTLASDTAPNAFTFSDLADVARGSVMTSNAITVAGINDAAPISVSGGAYSFDGGVFTSASGTVTAGKSVRVQHTSSAAFSTSVTTTLSIGGVSESFVSTTLARDIKPDAFAFQDQTNVARSTTVTSSEVTIAGINDAAPISVNGGQYSIDGGAFTYSAGTITSGQKVRVRHTTSSAFQTSMNSVLNVGGTSDTFTTTTQARDVVPNAFAFPTKNGVLRNTVVQSDEITVGGINDATPISVSGGEYSINGGAFTSAAGAVTNGQKVRVRHTSAAGFSASRQTALSIGGVSGSFTSVTEVEDTTPDAFTFQDQSGVAPLVEVTSNAITVTGINSPSAISVSGGTYAVNGGAYTSASGTVKAGDTVTLRVTAGAVPQSTVNVTLTIGGVSDTWTVRTLP